jgi:hypothetical protein
MSYRIAGTQQVARRITPIALYIAASLAMAACQHAAGGSLALAPRAARDTLRASEIGRYPNWSLYEIVQAARPLWITGRGRALSVSVDEAPPAGIDLLRSIPAGDVEEVRLLRSHSEVRVRPTLLPNGGIEYRDLLVVVTKKW